MLTTEFRPRTFSEMVGQQRTLSLLRAVLRGSGSLPSVFIFSGSAGSGKTTAARILAAQVNCENPSNGDACGTCKVCQDVAKGSSDALLEIDSAVFGNADNIRTLTELAELSTQYDYRVIVLDECHALSKTAFNALLKVMEEAPANIIFVLATTDPSKVLDTVKSRGVEFHFGPVPAADVVSRLRLIAQEVSVTTEQGALEAIANTAPSMRDAVKILDVLSTTTNKSISVTDVKDWVGDPGPVKEMVVRVVKGEDWSELFEDVVSRTPMAALITTLSDTLTALYRHKVFTTARYKESLDAVWDLTNVGLLDARGKTLVRLCFRRLDATIGPVLG